MFVMSINREFLIKHTTRNAAIANRSSSASSIEAGTHCSLI